MAARSITDFQGSCHAGTSPTWTGGVPGHMTRAVPGGDPGHLVYREDGLALVVGGLAIRDRRAAEQCVDRVAALCVAVHGRVLLTCQGGHELERLQVGDTR